MLFKVLHLSFLSKGTPFITVCWQFVTNGLLALNLIKTWTTIKLAGGTYYGANLHCRSLFLLWPLNYPTSGSRFQIVTPLTIHLHFPPNIVASLNKFMTKRNACISNYDVITNVLLKVNTKRGSINFYHFSQSNQTIDHVI